MFGKQIQAYEFGNNCENETLEPEMVNLFGTPFGNLYMHPSLSENRRWGSGNNTMDSKISCCTMALDNVLEADKIHPIEPRGIAMDPYSSMLATTNGQYLSIWRPDGMNWKLVTPPYNLDELLQKEEKAKLRCCCKTVFIMGSVTRALFRFENVQGRLILKSTVKERYFVTAEVVDFEVISSTRLIVQFSKWLGVYDLTENACIWRHGVAFARPHQVWSQTFKMIAQDQRITNDGWNKYGHQNHIYVSVNQMLLCVHPSLPVFEHVHVCDFKDHEDELPLFSPSAQYGTFYLSADRQSLWQSPDLNVETTSIILQLPQPLEKVKLQKAQHEGQRINPQTYFSSLTNVEFDEAYGISGRLLVYGTTTGGDFAFLQFMNLNDFKPLEDLWLEQPHLLQELLKNEHSQNFNLMTEVYAFLYGLERLQIHARDCGQKKNHNLDDPDAMELDDDVTN